MKYLTVFFVVAILCIYINAQEKTKNQNDDKKVVTKVYVNLTAESKGKVKENILNSEIIKILSESDNLIELKVGNAKLFNSLKAVFYFKDVDSYYNWYYEKKTQDLLARIQSDFMDYKFDLQLNKASN